MSSEAVDVLSCASSSFCAAVDGRAGNVITFNGTSWAAPVNITSYFVNYELVSGGPPYLVSVSCPSAAFCAVGDNIGNLYTRS